MKKLVVMSVQWGHREDVCYDEIGVRAHDLLILICSFMYHKLRSLV